MFKKLVKMVMEAKTQDELNAACGAIDRAFQTEKIKADENEILYGLVNRLY